MLGIILLQIDVDEFTTLKAILLYVVIKKENGSFNVVFMYLLKITNHGSPNHNPRIPTRNRFTHIHYLCIVGNYGSYDHHSYSRSNYRILPMQIKT